MKIELPIKLAGTAEADKILMWLEERGGVQVWRSQALEDMGQTKMSPVRSPEGVTYGPPHWKFGSTPAYTATSIDDFVVEILSELRRTPTRPTRIGRYQVVTYEAGDFVTHTIEKEITLAEYKKKKDGTTNK